MSYGVRPDSIPMEVLPPIPTDNAPAPQRERAPFEDLKTFYHPASGVVILGLDFLLFGMDFMTGFLATPLVCVLGFIATFPLVLAFQRAWSRDTMPHALGKAFLGAFLVGLPFQISGTLLGAAILMLSGLPHHPADVVKKAIASATPK